MKKTKDKQIATKENSIIENKIDIVFFGLDRKNHHISLRQYDFTISPSYRFSETGVYLLSDEPQTINFDFSEESQIGMDFSGERLITGFCRKGLLFEQSSQYLLGVEEAGNLGGAQPDKVIFDKNGTAYIITRDDKKVATDYFKEPVFLYKPSVGVWPR